MARIVTATALVSLILAAGLSSTGCGGGSRTYPAEESPPARYEEPASEPPPRTPEDYTENVLEEPEPAWEPEPAAPAPRRRAVVVSVNRGESAGIRAGEEFDVFSMGEDMVDPDTGEVLGSAETKVGRIQISQVLPKFSKAKLTGGEAYKGDICRRAADPANFAPHPGPGSASSGQKGKASLAIAPFTFHRSVRAIPGTELETATLTQKFVTALVKTNKFDVVERSRVDTLLEEMQFSEAGFTDPARAVKAGKMLGADFFLMGEISVWTLTSRVRPVPRTTRYFREGELRLIVDMRIVNTRTSKIVAAEKGDAVISWKRMFQSQPPADQPIEPARLDEIQRSCIQALTRKVIDTVYPLRVIAVSGQRPAPPPPPPADRQAPYIQFVAPAPGATVESAPVTVVVEVTDDREVRRVTINSVEVSGSANGRYKVRLSKPNVGENRIRVDAWDGVGNHSSEQSSFTYLEPDTQAPRIEILAPKDGRTINAVPINIVASVTDDTGVAKVTINGAKAAKDSQGRYRAKISRPRDGANRITVKAWDTAGNASDASATFTFDGTPPEVEANASLLVEGKVDDLGATLTINGQPVPFDRTTGKYSVRVPPNADDPGKVVIVAVDEFGNETREVRNVR